MHKSEKPIVETFSDGSAADWDAFVLSRPEGTFFHRIGWKRVLESAFGHRTHYLLARRGGDTVGVLPLAEIRSRLFGHTLGSTPFCASGGVLAADEEASRALHDNAHALATRLSVGSLELRGGDAPADLPLKELYVNFSRPLSDDHDANLQAVPRKQRAMIRKGIAAGLEAEETTDTARFFRVYSESVRNLGTPVFSPRLFAALKSEFGDDCRLLMITHEGTDVAGVMSFYHRDCVMPYYSGGTAAARALKANDFMYWELMRRSVDEGYRAFDYGRSKVGTGSYSFKKNWGFVPEPLPYRYVLVNDAEIPEINPMNPKYRTYIEAWKRLPLPLANAIGPWLSRSLG